MGGLFGLLLLLLLLCKRNCRLKTSPSLLNSSSILTPPFYGIRLADIALDLYILRLLTPLQVRASNFVNKIPTDQGDIDVALQLVDEWGRGFGE